MKRTYAMLVAALLLFGLIGCAAPAENTPASQQPSAPEQPAASEPQAEAPSDAGGKAEITVMYWFSEQADNVNESLEKFMSDNPDIQVNPTLVPWGDYWTKLQTTLPSGNGPDIYAVNVVNAYAFISNGYCLDIDAQMRAETDLSKYPQGILDLCTLDGRLHGVPKDYDVSIMYYNKDHFDEAGLEYPKDDWTWEDYVSMAQKLTLEEDGKITRFGTAFEASMQHDLFPLTIAAGGQSISADGSRCTVNTPQTLEAYQAFNDLIFTYKVSPTMEQLQEVSAMDRFVSGGISIHRNSNCMLSTIYPALGDSLGIAPVYSFNGQKATVYVPLIWAAESQTKNPDATWQVLKFLASEEGQGYNARDVIVAHADAINIFAEQFPGLHTDSFVAPSRDNWMYPFPVSKAAPQEVNMKFYEIGTELMSKPGVTQEDLQYMEDTINQIIDMEG